MKDGMLFVKRALHPFVPDRLFIPAAYCFQFASGELEPELRYLKHWTRPGSRAIDVGANFGTYAYAMLLAGAVVEASNLTPPALRS